ncbi:unnamed protein product [Lepeophtheirus salmonis]|uniref:(salmon louse) hypothetical protein n=1 Tax=Lepeophtheirus salmonis TaxID=72036 RepID=A0A7R8HDL8_LEPSM|nr:unnamed protein product [Lepeophtheirus salmonis]CAF3037284.1 unnamed protein product [Lepeophtheirus salmonis]
MGRGVLGRAKESGHPKTFYADAGRPWIAPSEFTGHFCWSYIENITNIISHNNQSRLRVLQLLNLLSVPTSKLTGHFGWSYIENIINIISRNNQAGLSAHIPSIRGVSLSTFGKIILLVLKQYQIDGRVKSFVAHEGYNMKTGENNIAIIGLHDRLVWNDKVLPICFSNDYFPIKDGQSATCKGSSSEDTIPVLPVLTTKREGSQNNSRVSNTALI